MRYFFWRVYIRGSPFSGIVVKFHFFFSHYGFIIVNSQSFFYFLKVLLIYFPNMLFLLQSVLPQILSWTQYVSRFNIITIALHYCFNLNGLEFVEGHEVFFNIILFLFLDEKKKEIWLSPMTKSPIPTEKSKTKGQHTNATKNFDYTTIADRLRTVSWSSKSSNWCGKNGLRLPNLPTNHKSRVFKWTHI